MKSELLNSLSKPELCELMLLGYEALKCDCQNDIDLLVGKLKKFFYFENALFVKSNVIELLDPANNSPTIQINNISYPAGYMDLYFERQFFNNDAAFIEWITNMSPVNWLDIDKSCGFNYPVSVSANDFNLNDGWTCGTLDPSTMDCHGFYLGSDKIASCLRTYKIIEYITPFLTQAYQSFLCTRRTNPVGLTRREVEVLNWVKEGKSSWEISLIISCSKRTVDFHIKNIKVKLNAVTRPQAVATGLKKGIIHF